MNLPAWVLTLSFKMSEAMGKRRLMLDVKALNEGSGLIRRSEENSNYRGIGPHIQVVHTYT